MRDRELAPAAFVAAIVCSGSMALIAVAVGGVALAAIGRFTMVSVAGLVVVMAIAWQLARRRHRPGRRAGTTARPADLEETT